MANSLLDQASPLDDADTQSVLVKPTRAFAPVTPAPQAAPAPVTIAPKQPSVVEKPRDYYSNLRGQESGNDPFAHSKTSSAAGLYQFTDSTWRGVAARHPELGLTPNGRFDPAQEEKAIRAFTQDNAKILEQHDINVNPGNLYIMHFMGEGAGPKFLRAAQETPAAPAATLFPKEAAANSTIFFQGGDPSKPRSLAQVYALQTKRFGGATVSEAPTRVAMNDTGIMTDASPGFSKMDFSDDAPFPSAKPKQDFSDDAPFPSVPPGAVQRGGPKEDEDPYGLVTGPTGNALKALNKIYKIVADPEKAITSGAQGIYELATHPTETVKGALSGAAQAVGGAGQAVGMLPGVPESVGEKATESIKRWQEYGKGAPAGAEELGYLGMSAFPVTRAAELAGGAIKGSSLLASAARPAAEVAAGGTALGAIEPSVAATPSKQFAEKAEAAGGNILLGGGLGLGLGGAKLAGKLPETLRAAGGAEAEAAIEGVRKTAVEKAAEAVKAEEARAAEVGEAAGAKEAKLAKLEKVGEKRAQAVEQEAKAAEQREKEAAAHSQAQVTRREQLEKAAAEVDAAQRARPTMDSKDYGGLLQKTASDYAKAQDKILKEGAGYAKMLEEAPQGNVVKTDKLLSDVDAALGKTKDPNIKGLLEDAKKWLVTKEGELTENAISFEEAESLKKLWQTAYRKQDQAVLTNAYSDAAASRAVLNKLYGDLRDEMVAAHPAYGETLAKYAELSRGGDIVKRGGDLRKLIAEDDLSHKFKMNTGDVVGAVLSKAKGGSEGLKTLIEHNPELKDATRQYFNKEIFGPEGAAKTVTEKTIKTALQKHEYALKDAGLWEEFSGLAKERAGAAAAVAEAKAGETAAVVKAKDTERLNKEVLSNLGKKVGEVEKRSEATQKSLDELATKKKHAEQAKKDYGLLKIDLEEVPAEGAAGLARSFAKKIAKDERINDVEYRQMVRDINSAEVEFQKHKDAVRHRNNLLRIVAATTLGTFAAREGITHLRGGGIIP